jgi:hypothetical protein
VPSDLAESGRWVHAAAVAWSFSWSIGVSMPRALWRRRRLWKLQVLAQGIGELDATPVEQLSLHPAPEGHAAELDRASPRS